MIKLTSQRASHELALSQLPARVGRSAGAALRVQEAGVWDNHARLSLEGGHFHIRHEPGAIVYVNDHVVEHARLRNGDRVALGSAKFRFEISSPARRPVAFHEALVWGAVGLVTALQVGILVVLFRS